MLGRKVDALEADKWWLIDRITPPGDALETAKALALEYAKLPPLAARMAKEAIDASAQALGFAASHMDRDQFLLARGSDDHKQAVAAFLDKRKPDSKEG